VLAPERDGIKARFHTSFDFLGNQPSVGTSGVSEFSAVTSPVARIFKMYLNVETPVVDVRIGQDWSKFGFMSEYSRGQVSVATIPAQLFNRWVQASVSKRLRMTDTLVPDSCLLRGAAATG
jgi:hypothetical protein